MEAGVSSSMLKKSASIVLASLRGSTLRSAPRIFGTLNGLFRSPRSIERANGYTKCGPYLLASSLAAALLYSLFEHPAVLSRQRHSATFHRHVPYEPSFSAFC
jgi:hypothetical protein